MMEECDLKDIEKDITDEDVLSAVRELKLNISITAEELKKIHAIAFRHAQSRVASKMCVMHAMSREVISVSKFDPISEAVKMLSEKNVSGLPVVDRENRVVGIISEADIVSMVGARRTHTLKELFWHMLGHPLPDRKVGDLVGDIMSSPAVTIKADVEISEAVRVMDQRRIRRLPVVDKNQRLVGILSRADIVRAMGRNLVDAMTDTPSA